MLAVRGAGDELLALDGWRIKRPDDLVQWHSSQHSQPLLISRDQRVLTLTLPALDAQQPARASKGRQTITQLATPQSVIISLAASSQASDAALHSRRAWLHA